MSVYYFNYSWYELAFIYLRKKTNKLESVLLARQRLGKDKGNTSLDIYIYFQTTNQLRYFILCKHWQEININKMIPDEQLQLIVMTISPATACFSYWTIVGISYLKVSVTFQWRISEAWTKWQWKIVYYHVINDTKNHGVEDKSFIHNYNFHAVASLFISLHCMSVFTFILLALQLRAALASKTDTQDLYLNFHFLEHKLKPGGIWITKIQ